jgi:hypothetical protein
VPDAPGLDQSLGAGRNRVADNAEIPRAPLVQRGEQAERCAGTRAEAGDGDRRSVGQVPDRVGRRGTQLVHVPSLRPQDRSDYIDPHQK